MGQAENGIPKVSVEQRPHLGKCCSRTVATLVVRSPDPGPGLRLSLLRVNQADFSYAALGLLPSIPIPHGASSSRSHRAELQLPGSSTATQEQQGEEAHVPVSYGRIIRDEDGNVIDIILEEEENAKADKEAAMDVEEEGEGATRAPVVAKTDVVRCE